MPAPQWLQSFMSVVAPQWVQAYQGVENNRFAQQLQVANQMGGSDAVRNMIQTSPNLQRVMSHFSGIPVPAAGAGGAPGAYPLPPRVNTPESSEIDLRESQAQMPILNYLLKQQMMQQLPGLLGGGGGGGGMEQTGYTVDPTTGDIKLSYGPPRVARAEPGTGAALRQQGIGGGGAPQGAPPPAGAPAGYPPGASALSAAPSPGAVPGTAPVGLPAGMGNLVGPGGGVSQETAPPPPPHMISPAGVIPGARGALPPPAPARRLGGAGAQPAATPGAPPKPAAYDPELAKARQVLGIPAPAGAPAAAPGGQPAAITPAPARATKVGPTIYVEPAETLDARGQALQRVVAKRPDLARRVNEYPTIKDALANDPELGALADDEVKNEKARTGAQVKLSEEQATGLNEVLKKGANIRRYLGPKYDQAVAHMLPTSEEGLVGGATTRLKAMGTSAASGAYAEAPGTAEDTTYLQSAEREIIPLIQSMAEGSKGLRITTPEIHLFGGPLSNIAALNVGQARAMAYKKNLLEALDMMERDARRNYGNYIK